MKYPFILLFALSLVFCSGQLMAQADTAENYRPKIHFSPKEKWMNDPNGMVFYKGVYHLFYQFHPNSSVWGPMHWGHATSKDLVHWKHEPIGIYPDSLGTIFSGSIVADISNTSGLGTKANPPLIAIFTHHNTSLEKTGSSVFQYQSIAYSVDDGRTWSKYEGNPVLKNPGIRDFRDPKVMWFEDGKKWIMTLATMDRITFYSSKDLKGWTRESEFGKEVGAHGGVWECPDLFPLEHNGKKTWILLVSINPGGPNGGSATQYFTGEFDGSTFTPYQTDTRWIDYGPDNYAGVTWSNTGKRKIFLGWMSNWQYAQSVPTYKWRSAMTVPRELSLNKIGEKYFIASTPSKEMNVLAAKTFKLENIKPTNFDLTAKVGKLQGSARLKFSAGQASSFTITLSNELGEKLVMGYDKEANQYFIDRGLSGIVAFEKGFAARHTAPRISDKSNLDVELIIDKASVELFADGGLSVMTEIFFPNKPYDKLTITSRDNLVIKKLSFSHLRSALK